MFYPKLQEPNQYREMTEQWLGYNANLRIGNGELSNDMNMSAMYYPVLSTRKHRGTVASLSSPQGMIAKDALAYVDGAYLYFNGTRVPEVALSIREEDQPKTLVGIGAYIVIFPDGVYVNTVDLSDWGKISQENERTATTQSPVTVEICKADSSSYSGEVTTSDTAPADPENGDVWIDTSQDAHTLKIWSSVSAMWLPQATSYVKISSNGIGTGINDYDGVTISGLTGDAAALNGSHIVYGVGANHVVVVGLVDNTATQTSGNVALARKAPEMDYVIEAGNRLWGCKYGSTEDGKVVNEIYASALGDFKNWQKYQGVSTDSWYGEVGSDGMFTGAINYLGQPIFFKENCIHTVAISTVGAHQISTTNCRGIQRGSSKSVCVVGKTVFYKSPVDFCAYEGALPTGISAQLGDRMYTDAVCGSLGSLYYVTCTGNDGEQCSFVYDAAKGIWHREACAHALCYARVDTELYYIDGSTSKLMTVNGSEGTSEGDFPWLVETGELGYEYPDNKYVSRFNWRMNLAVGAEAEVFVMYDSDGTWRPRGHIHGSNIRTFTLPVIPQRCDHLKIRIVGIGDCRIYSLARILEIGSDVV